MGIMQELAVLIILFIEIIMQCEGYPNPAGPSRNSTRDPSTFDSLGLVSGKKECFENHIVLIDGFRFNGEIRENCQDDDIFYEFGNYQSVKSFFERFGNDVRKIQINDTAIKDDFLSIHAPRFIKQFAKNLNELRITSDDEKLWDKLGEDIRFPNVKKFHFYGTSSRDEFRLSSLFGTLESVRLSGSIKDKNCLAGVNTLNELELLTESIDENDFGSIFANNNNIWKLALTKPEKMETIRLIAENLRELVTLHVTEPGENFLCRTAAMPEIIEIPTVMDFSIKCDHFDQFSGIPLFDMPNLKRFTLNVKTLDPSFLKFIKYFKAIEYVEIIIRDFSEQDTNRLLKSMITVGWKKSYLGRDMDGAHRILYERPNFHRILKQNNLAQ